MLFYGDWVEDEVLAPVPHRQYVFTVPKPLRPHFHRRHRLGELCRIVSRLITGAYREVDPAGQPGLVLFVQTFGDLVTFHPHIHALVADGVFQANGVFRVLPPISTGLLEEQLRHAVLDLMLADEAIDEPMVERVLGWRHSGFSVDNQVRIAASDTVGRQQLARYMIRGPFALEKMEYKADSGVIVYRSKLHASLKRNFVRLIHETHLRPWRLAREFAPGELFRSFLAPSGWSCCSSTCRTGASIWFETTAGIATAPAACGARTSTLVEGALEHVDLELSRAAKRAWVRLIRKVYEVDPRLCPRCGAGMRVMAVIEEAPGIERILRHLGCWAPRPPSQAPPANDDWPTNGQMPLSYCPLPDIA